MQKNDGTLAFMFWDVRKNDIIRKWEYSVYQYITKEERYAFAKQRIDSINKILTVGFHIDVRKSNEIEEEIKEVTALDEAIRKILKSLGLYQNVAFDFSLQFRQLMFFIFYRILPTSYII